MSPRHLVRDDDDIERAPPILIGDADRAALEQCIAEAAADEAEAARLDGELSRAVVLPQEELPDDVVRIGARVVFENEDTGVQRCVEVVLPAQADAAAGRVSVLAPIGAALIGLAPGQRIMWSLPDGRTARLRVCEILAG